MLFLKIEEKCSYIWNSQVENNSGFIFVNTEFHNFKDRHAKHALDFGNSIFKIQNHKNIVM
jgi:hypothetical protein